MTIEIAVRPSAVKPTGSTATSGSRIGAAPADDPSSGFTSALADAETASDVQKKQPAEEDQPARSDKEAVALDTLAQDAVLVPPKLTLAEPVALAPSDPLAAVTPVDLATSLKPALVELPTSLPVPIQATPGGSDVLEVPSVAALDGRQATPSALMAEALVARSAVSLPGESSPFALALPPKRGELAAPGQVTVLDANNLAPDATGLRQKPVFDSGARVEEKITATAVAIEAMDARASGRAILEARPATDQEHLRPVATPLVTPPVESGFRREFKSEKSIFRSDGATQSDVFSLAKADFGLVRQGGAAAETQSGASGYSPQQADAGKYWISGDLKNAELKLDGLGDSPVEVSISMTGKEAHVAFRSDESQTRTMLENANAELKELLGKEGLQLAGVSVGAKGSGDSGQSDQRPRHGYRPTADLKEFTDRVESSGRWSSGTGQAIDLFV